MLNYTKQYYVLSLIPKPSESAYYRGMTLSTALFALQILAGFVALGYLCWIFSTPKCWKPRSRSMDEYLEDMEQNGITVLHRSDKK